MIADGPQMPAGDNVAVEGFGHVLPQSEDAQP